MTTPKSPRVSASHLSATSIIAIGILVLMAVIGIWQSVLPYFAERDYREGFNRDAQQNYSAAIAFHQQAVSEAPWEVQYKTELGKSYENYAGTLAKTDEKLIYLGKAEAVYRQSIAYDKMNPWYRNRLGNVLLQYAQLKPYNKTKYLTEAEDQFKTASVLDHNNPLFQLSLAYFYHQTNRLDEAQIYYEKSLDIDDRILEAHFNLADIYRRTNRFNLAIDQYAEIYVASPNFQNIPDILGTAYVQQRQYAKAAKIYEAQVKQRPFDYMPLRKLADTYLMMKDWQKAVDTYKRISQAYIDAPIQGPYQFALSQLHAK